MRSGSAAVGDRIVTVFGGTGFLGRRVVGHLPGVRRLAVRPYMI
jgi:hypothetical protein